ncbi:MAG: nucleoside triphosphate hydrolase [Rhizobiaceae bacterium]
MRIEDIADRIIERASDKNRYIVSIAGPPGAGKSTFATALNTRLAAQGLRSKIIPMDGFHLDNEVLSSLGLLAKKGAPETFDIAGFVQLINRLAGEEDHVAFPIFDRDRDLSIAEADVVTKSDQILIVEGNYLLIDQRPWSGLKALWDESIFINPEFDVLEERLIGRWLDQGHDMEKARERALSNDIPNARYVLENSFPANIQIR